MRIKTFCPGHITGFFQICEHRDPWRSGSRGAGLCVDRGVHATIDIEEGNGEVFIRIDGKEAKAPVTELAVFKVIEDRRLDVSVDATQDLPVGQGFGMSAAGALSAAHGVTELLGMPFKVALRAAHEAEVESRTGLGDVAALSRGGMTFRRVEGLPPFGRVDRINAEPDVVLCAVGAPLPTAEVLSDEKVRQRINAVGKECVAKMAMAPTMATLMRLSREFMNKTGLASPAVEEAVKAAEDYGPASMAMLGNSVFAVGKAKDQDRVLSERGETFRARVDWRGPRVIAGESEND